MTWTRPTDEHGRAFYAPNEVPPATAEFAHWLGKLTHPSAVVTNRGKSHRCIGGWVESGEWWLHCGVCRPVLIDGRIASVPGGGDTVFGVPSRCASTPDRENFPPASGTDTPLVATGEPNESDSSEKRQRDGLEVAE